METIKFFTLGCKVNQYETQDIRERFISVGFKEVHGMQKADTYVINTCTVTSAADRKSRYFIHFAHRQNPKARIIVTGCYAQLDSDEIAKIRGVTQIIKNQDKHRIIELLNKQDEYSVISKCKKTGISTFSGHTRTFLKIQDGCNNSCSYCKVPKVRGPSRSKPLSEIIDETDKLLKNCFKEIVLTGICLGSYGKDLTPKTSLVNVIDALENIDGLFRIRLSSIEAGDISEDLIQKIARSKKICPHLHIPIQSGDDEILKRMNRSYSRQDYINLIKKIKKRIPDISITTDIMVGFPGENEVNFNNTVDLVREILPLKVHLFPYSPRNSTLASSFKDTINPIIIKERISRLKNTSDNCSLIYKKKFLNKNMDVLIEERAKENKDYWEGYTGNYIRVRVKPELSLKNKLIPLQLKKIVKDYVLADFINV